MAMKFTNNATSTLATGINNSVTSLSVASGQGALFPTLGGSDYFYCTLANTAGTVEIVKVTARSTDTFTIVRGQDNTTAATWLSGDRVELRLVAASLNDIPKLDEANTFTTAPTFSTALAITSGGTGGATAAAARAALDAVGVSDTQTLTAKTISGADNTLTVDGTNAIGFKKIPQSNSDKTTSYALVTTDVGKFIGVGTGGSITIPDATFSTGDAVVVFNNTSGTITITCTITTAYIGGTNTDKSSVTLASRGVCNILFISGTVCVITGNVT